MLDTTTLSSVVCQQPGQTLAAAQLINNTGAGETVGGQEVDGPWIGATSNQPTHQGEGGGFFKKLPLSAAIQFFKVLVEERR